MKNSKSTLFLSLVISALFATATIFAVQAEANPTTGAKSASSVSKKSSKKSKKKMKNTRDAKKMSDQIGRAHV